MRSVTMSISSLLFRVSLIRMSTDARQKSSKGEGESSSMNLQLILRPNGANIPLSSSEFLRDWISKNEVEIRLIESFPLGTSTSILSASALAAIMNPSVYSPFMSPSAHTMRTDVPEWLLSKSDAMEQQSSPINAGMQVVTTYILLFPSEYASSKALLRNPPPPNTAAESSIRVQRRSCSGLRSNTRVA